MAKKPLYTKIKEYLLKKIEEMGPDTRIPSRNKLIEEFGVTRTTVERAISELIGEGYLYTINGSGTYVADLDEMRTKINASKSIGVLLPSIGAHDYPQILQGINEVVDEHGFNLLINDTDHDPEKQKRNVKQFVNSEVNGLIIVPIFGDIEIDSFKLLEEEGIPFVFCNRGIDGIKAPWVIANDYYGAYLATNNFIELGYKNIGFISAPFYSIIADRFEGYLTALQENEIEVDDDIIYFEEERKDEKYGIKGMNYLLKSEKNVNAVLCTDDDIAFQAYKVITDKGLKVPEDIALVGFDNSSICETMSVPLTSVDLKKHESGKIAARTVIKMINNQDDFIKPIYTLKPELSVRESCGSGIN